MLVLLPALLPLLTALAIVVWQRARPGYGIPWLLAATMALANWGLLLALRFRMPLFLVMNTWFELGERTEFPHFQLDIVSWPYAFSLAGLALAVIFTASARLLSEVALRSWAGSLAIAGVGMLAVLSANPLTMAATWTVIDLIELVVLLAALTGGQGSYRVVLAFSARVASTFLLLWSIFQGRASGASLTFGQMPQDLSMLLLLAGGLRLGVLPLHLPYMAETAMRRGMGTILRLVSPAAGLALLARLPGQTVPAGWETVLLTLTALATAYCAVMWLTAADEISGRPYWLIALAGLTVACGVRGQPVAGMAWGMALLLSGGAIFLYSARDRAISWLPVLGLVGLAGLPFTPTAAGWSGLLAQPPGASDVIFWFAHLLLLFGYFRHAFAPGEALAGMERWVQALYPLGIILLFITQVIISIFNMRSSFALGSSWAGVLSAVGALAGGVLFGRVQAVTRRTETTGWFVLLTGRVLRPLAAFFRLDWFYAAFAMLYRLLRRAVNAITLILEGDGGVLWVLVLLALLASVIHVGGSP